MQRIPRSKLQRLCREQIQNIRLVWVMIDFEVDEYGRTIEHEAELREFYPN